MIIYLKMVYRCLYTLWRCVSYDITRVTRTTTSVYTHFFANNGTTYVPPLDSLFGKQEHIEFVSQHIKNLFICIFFIINHFSPVYLFLLFFE